MGGATSKNYIANGYAYEIYVHIEGDKTRVKRSEDTGKITGVISDVTGNSIEGSVQYSVTQENENEPADHSGLTTIQPGKFLYFQPDTSSVTSDTVYVTIYSDKNEDGVDEVICEGHPCSNDANFIIDKDGQLQNSTEDGICPWDGFDPWIDTEGNNHNPSE